MKDILNTIRRITIIVALLAWGPILAQKDIDSTLLSIDRIYSGEFQQQGSNKIQWIENGEGYVMIEKSKIIQGADELVYYSSLNQERSLFVPAKNLKVNNKSISIQSFSLSLDATKVLIFTNSSRVWRSNTKGDYWVYDFHSKELKQIGKEFGASSLMFAKFSSNNNFVFYVSDFDIYKEDFKTGEITQLTFGGDGKIINGTFDWAYEEEFGKRDGFLISPSDKYVAFWNLDTSKTGTFYMINNTDSIYSKPIPLQYPKVGQDPAITKIGLIDLDTQKTVWLAFENDKKDNYIPGIQWVNSDLLLIQQLNRKQNRLVVWSYKPSTKVIKKVYTEIENTWVDLQYPDVSKSSWANNDLQLVDKGSSFIRMTETNGWRQVYKVNIETGEKLLITPFNYDVASLKAITSKYLYFMASPKNSMQRYLYYTDLKGKGMAKRLTPQLFNGLNNYDISPNGKYAIHTHESVSKVRTVRFISLPDHKTLKVLVENEAFEQKLTSLKMPEIKFFEVEIPENIKIDVKMILPINFNNKFKYPVIFKVYGEPAGQIALDSQLDLWDIFMAQKGYVIINMDNRGTPCLKGSEWRKSIYRKVGVLNTRDQAMAAKEVLKMDFIDENRTCVWGWSGGGSMTLNLMFKYPEVYKTGIAVAAVSDQLVYDNIYQERYMGLPQENLEDFIIGSPVSHAKNLEGNLLIVHGTGDDNVHYQSAEILINELIRENKQFQMMAYPNRSHSIYEGLNTRKHLYTLITKYIMEKVAPNELNN